jgi:hypothetical protein
MQTVRLVGCLAAMLAAPALAEPGHSVQSGEGLMKMCNGADKVKMLGMMCHSYLNGYLDTSMHNRIGKPFCLGTGDKQGLPVKVVTWLNAHPDHLKKPAPEALGKLLAENYPCKK